MTELTQQNRWLSLTTVHPFLRAWHLSDEKPSLRGNPEGKGVEATTAHH